MDREFTLGLMEKSMKESGRRVKGMDRGLTLGLMEKGRLKESLKREKCGM